MDGSQKKMLFYQDFKPKFDFCNEFFNFFSKIVPSKPTKKYNPQTKNIYNSRLLPQLISASKNWDTPLTWGENLNCVEWSDPLNGRKYKIKKDLKLQSCLKYENLQMRMQLLDRAKNYRMDE